MGRSKRAALEQPVAGPNDGGEDGGAPLTAMELERAAIIARNRERLMALGIPSLVSELQQVAAAAGGGMKAASKKRAPKEPWEAREKRRKKAGQDQPQRRSSRLQEAADQPKPEPETAKQRFKRELGVFVVEGVCPRCGRQLERGHRSHLQACTGVKPRQSRRPRAQGEDELEGMSEEELRDQQKRALARMKKLHLDGLTSLTEEEAKFVVLGSTGSHYTVTLKDGNHTCQCLDYRFRRHHCKHICLVLSQLAILDKPEQWKAAVEERMDQLMQQQRERRQQEAKAPPPPRIKEEEVALKFL